MGEKVCQNGRCVGTVTGDYQCRCEDGYTNSADMKKCIGNRRLFCMSLVGRQLLRLIVMATRICFLDLDINECGEGAGDRDICGLHGTCMNTDGAFKCMCDNGFENAVDANSCIGE